MKRRFNTNQMLIIGVAVLFYAALPVWGQGNGSSDEADPGPVYLEEGMSDYFNSVEAKVGGVSVEGDEAQFMQREQTDQGVWGGVENFHWEKFVGQKGLLRIDARGLFEQHEYSLDVEYEETDLGFVRAGYNEYRTWYDGSGGFFHPNDGWFPLFSDELHVDRGKAWLEAGLRKPDLPEITVGYTYRFRDGKKGSLVWGDTEQTGGRGVRGIVPSFWDLAENRHIVEVDGEHTFGSTDVGLGLRYEQGDRQNERHMRRDPGDAEDRHVTHEEGVRTDLFNTHAYTRTELNDRTDFTTAYSFTRLNTDLSGSRVYGSDFDPVYDPTFRGQFEDEGFLDLGGGHQLNQHVVNLNVMYLPHEKLKLVPSVRVEGRELDGLSRFRETNAGLVGRPPDEKRIEQDQGRLDVSESLEVTYTGIPDWVFYARGNWTQGEGEREERKIDVSPERTELFRDTDTDRLTQKYTTGVNWYALRSLTLSSQYYHKIRDYDYTHEADSTVNGAWSSFPAFLEDQSFETDDVNFRVTWRPLNEVTLVSRYDFQFSTIDTRADGLSEVESGKMTSHIFSESLTWTPWQRLYFQGSVNYVMDELDTPSDTVGGAAENLVLTAENDYWNGSLSAGYAIAKRTDLETRYFYYRAQNFSDNSEFSQPYGAESEQHGITVSLKRRVSERLLWKIQYGFYTNDDTTFGGRNDYDAHLLATSMKYVF